MSNVSLDHDGNEVSNYLETVVMLNSQKDVQNFVNLCSSSMCEVDMLSGRYVIDGKSIMGIFSLDLSKPITVHVRAVEQSDMEDLIAKINANFKA